MPRSILRLCALAALCLGAFGQTPDAAAGFEAADVHVSPRSSQPGFRVGFSRNRYELRMATMLDLIRTAWDVPDSSVAGGPAWLEADRFDVIVKMPNGASPESVRPMLKALLADRFGLVLHDDSRPVSSYVLTLVKRNPQLKESSGEGSPNCDSQPSSVQFIGVFYACKHTTMNQLAKSLGGWAPGYVAGVPIQDQTGLKGEFDFTIGWTGRGNLSTAGSDGVSLFGAVEKLGLKLELKNVAQPVIVVDKVNRKPTENAPGVTQKLPALPTEFEVATLKPSRPEEQSQFQMGAGGRIDAQAIPLKDLIEFAWDMEDAADDMISGPKWLDTVRFDIVAKPPALASGQGTDLESVRPMLRTMLMDRFRMKVHMEDGPVVVHALVAPKQASKLKPANPANRTSCKRANAATNGASVALVGITCQNADMDFFAQKLRELSAGYFDHPVVNATGIEGAFDLSVNFSTRRAYENSLKNGAANSAATDPNGAVSLFEGLDRQLGLKVELQKRTMPILVIDHVEQTPTDN